MGILGWQWVDQPYLSVSDSASSLELGVCLLFCGYSIEKS